MAKITLTLRDVIENGVQAVRMEVRHNVKPNSKSADLPPTQAMNAAIHMIQEFKKNSGIPMEPVTTVKDIVEGTGEVHRHGFVDRHGFDVEDCAMQHPASDAIN